MQITESTIVDLIDWQPHGTIAHKGHQWQWIMWKDTRDTAIAIAPLHEKYICLDFDQRYATHVN